MDASFKTVSVAPAHCYVCVTKDRWMNMLLINHANQAFCGHLVVYVSIFVCINSEKALEKPLRCRFAMYHNIDITPRNVCVQKKINMKSANLGENHSGRITKIIYLLYSVWPLRTKWLFQTVINKLFPLECYCRYHDNYNILFDHSFIVKLGKKSYYGLKILQ